MKALRVLIPVRLALFRLVPVLLAPVLLLTAACGPENVTGSPPEGGPSAAVGDAEKFRTPVADKAMPNLVGRRLSEARAVLKEAGFPNVRAADASDRNRPILEPDNWIVREQSPRAGLTVPLTNEVVLRATKPTDDQGSSTTTGGVVPNVVCKDLQAAQDAFQAAGFYNLRSEDGAGQGRHQVVDRNWVVTAQSVKPGSKPEPLTVITLTAVKFGESTGAAKCPR